MARNGSGVYSLPAGSVIANGDTSDAADLNTPLADIEADLNTPRPVVAGGTGADNAADALVNLGLTATAAEINVLDGVTASTAEINLLDGVTRTTAQLNATGQLAGRNRIINGQGRINQRAYTSGTATSGANQYTLDRWRVVTSGQSLTFTGNDAGRTMTAPAGGVEQVIEGANIEGGTYVLNWTGTATATVNGTARTKGETFTLTANTDATVRFSSGTFTDVQLELGSTPTIFERLPLGQEFANCQRYYETGAYYFALPINNGTVVASYSQWVSFAVRKRTTPTVTGTNDQGTFAALLPSVNGVGLGRSTVVADRTNSGTFIADAEL